MESERREALAAAWFTSRHPECEWSDANDWWRTKAFMAVDTWLAPLLAEWSAQDRAAGAAGVVAVLAETWEYARRQHAEPPDTTHPTARHDTDSEERHERP